MVTRGAGDPGAEEPGPSRRLPRDVCLVGDRRRVWASRARVLGDSTHPPRAHNLGTEVFPRSNSANGGFLRPLGLARSTPRRYTRARRARRARPLCRRSDERSLWLGHELRHRL